MPEDVTLLVCALRYCYHKSIIPIGASNLDAAAMTDLMTVVELARDYNPNLDVRVYLRVLILAPKTQQKCWNF